jgi:hypothetical protein
VTVTFNYGSCSSSTTLTVAGPDLIVESLTVTPAGGTSTFAVGGSATFTVCIKNVGSVAANNFRLDSWLDWPVDERLVEPDCGAISQVFETVATLPPGASLTFTYQFDLSYGGTYHAYALVDSQCEVNETETGAGSNRASDVFDVLNAGICRPEDDPNIQILSVSPAAGGFVLHIRYDDGGANGGVKDFKVVTVSDPPLDPTKFTNPVKTPSGATGLDMVQGYNGDSTPMLVTFFIEVSFNNGTSKTIRFTAKNASWPIPKP